MYLTLDAVAKDYQEWADSLFSKTPLSFELEHLRQEVEELTIEYQLYCYDKENFSELEDEMADVFMLALHIAKRLNIDVAKVIARKTAKAKNFEWLPPNEKGEVYRKK